MANRNVKAPIVFLACPYGQIGGGMGSIMSYLASLGTDPSGQFRLVCLETRGGRHIIFSPFYLLYAISRIIIEAVRGRLAIVHINLADGTSVYRKALILFAAQLTKTKVLLHLHAGRLIPMYESMGTPGKKLLQAMVQRADHCIVLGKQWRHWLIETLGVRPDTVSVVYNGVPATTSPRKPRAAGAPFRFLFVGNLFSNKGVADLLQAFALPELRNAPLTLTLAGGGAIDQYQAMAAQLHITERVRFTGWVSQATVRDLLLEADALVLPSYVEGLPLVILEAIASRVPVICTPVGTIPELFKDGTTALFVAPGDPAGLAKRMLALSRNTGLQERLGEAGFALYQEKFSMATFREQISSLYSELARKDAAIEMPDQSVSDTMPVSRLARLRNRFSREKWNLGLVPQSAADIVRHGITTPIQWLPRHGPWDMLADPACLSLPDGTRILFAEYMNQWIGRGEIWVANVPPSGNFAQAAFRPWIRSNGHLSYPFPFRDESGRLCFMLESGQARALHLWREDDGALLHVGPIIHRPVIDATPWHDGTRWWLFCTMQDDGPNERLHLFHAQRLEGPWTAHPGNPVKRDPGSSRPAGPLFHVDGRLIRPAQDCSRTYGGAVVLHEVVRLDEAAFHEVPVRRLEPDAAYPHGLHTVCPAGGVTIIDGKRWDFQALDLPRKVIAGVQNRTRPLWKKSVPSCIILPVPVPVLQTTVASALPEPVLDPSCPGRGNC